jgi:catechol 2,3-dioxygenase-like lactoylglutathione lyase family enzyme
MITGAHTIIFSTNADADRAFLRDVLEFTNIDLGGGWLVFGLPPAELAVHPASENGAQEFYLMCDDVQAFIAKMETHGVACDPVHDERWGRLTRVTMPSGAPLRVYEPRHARPPQANPSPAARKPAKQPAAKKPAAKKPAAKKPAAKKSAAKKSAKSTGRKSATRRG